MEDTVQHKCKILVVDDDNDILTLLSRTLGNHDFIVETASNSEEAIKEMSRFKPDLVILDIIMPGIDGHKLCEQIRSYSTFDTTPIIFHSGLDSDFEIIKGFALGCDAYMVKSADITPLVEKVKEMIQA